MGSTQFVGESLTKHFILKGYKVDIFMRRIIEVTFSGMYLHITGDRNDEDNLKN